MRRISSLPSPLPLSHLLINDVDEEGEDDDDDEYDERGLDDDQKADDLPTSPPKYVAAFGALIYAPWQERMMGWRRRVMIIVVPNEGEGARRWRLISIIVVIEMLRIPFAS